MKELDVKFKAQETALTKQDASFKTFDAAFKSEIAKLQKQVADLGEGKVTSAEELARVGDE